MKQREKAKGMAAGSAGTAADTETTTFDEDRSPRTVVNLTDEEIATRAYMYWAARGFEAGCPEEDWYRAIEELTLERIR